MTSQPIKHHDAIASWQQTGIGKELASIPLTEIATFYGKKIQGNSVYLEVRLNRPSKNAREQALTTKVIRIYSSKFGDTRIETAKSYQVMAEWRKLAG